MAVSPDSDGRPDPSTAATAADFVEALRRLKSWSGMGLRQLESRAAAAGQVLPRSTVTGALSRVTLPREDLLITLVHACGVDDEEVARWVAARRRIAATPPDSSRPPTTPSVPPAAADGLAAIGGSPGPVHCTLPADQAVFVGREKELEYVAAEVTAAAQGGGVIAICAIAGMPGIGKTTLAVHVAHRLKDRFADRQLFIDLHAHTPGQRPTEPGDALAELLTADGVKPQLLPTTVDGRAGLWRHRMASKQLLLVLDNVASTQQILPLLPGSPRCLVLVTSRRSLGDLPTAVRMPLDVLTPDEAAAMFVQVAPRAAAHPRAVADLVEVCGYLPLAISIAASVYMRHRAWTIADLLREAHRSSGGPLTLTAENRTVAAVFDLSYQRLPEEWQRFFCRLGLHPGADIDAHAAAALTDTPQGEAQQYLDGLQGNHLVEESLYRRYRMHDLIRAYAARLAEREETQAQQQAALSRLLDYYRSAAATAIDAVYPNERRFRPTVPPAGSSIPNLSDKSRAEPWLDAELANLLAAAYYAAEHGWPEHTWQLSILLHRHMRTRGRYRDAETLHQQALDLARHHGNHPAEMASLIDLGYICWRVGCYEQAHEHYQQAMRIAQDIGERNGELTALNGLGHIHRRLGHHHQAGESHRRALQIAQDIGDRSGELDALNGLGHIHLAQSRYSHAGEHYRRALQIAQDIGDRNGEVTAVQRLGELHWTLGHYEQASEHYQDALRIAQDIGDRNGELDALNGLGHIHLAQSRYNQAGELYQDALRIAQDIGDRNGELNALNGLGHFHRTQSHYEQAAKHYQQALDLGCELNSANWQFEALQGLGRLHHTIGEHSLALAHHEQALQLAVDLSQPTDQARALDGLAHAHLALGELEQARRQWQRTLDILIGLGTAYTEEVQTSVPRIRAHLAALVGLQQQAPSA